jgi:NADP-dependent 3-hydroxy acid dehydrogenase YdfG
MAIIGNVLGDTVAIVKEVEEKLGGIDVLINNAGNNRAARFAEETDINVWWEVFEVNVKAPIAMIYAVLPGFVKRGKGTVITVGSAAVDVPVPFQSSYDSSKAAVQKAIQILDMELREKGIFNFLIQPGVIKMDLSQGEGVVGKQMGELMDSWSSVCSPMLFPYCQYPEEF